jgi:hypothetical protein
MSMIRMGLPQQERTGGNIASIRASSGCQALGISLTMPS